MTSEPAPTAPGPTNLLAIWALVAAFVLPFIGMVLGIVARRQIKRTGEQGQSLALASIIIGAVLGVLGVILWTIVIALVVGIGEMAGNLSDMLCAGDYCPW